MGEIGTCGRIGQVVLVIVNLLFAALGIAICVAGAFLKYKENLVNGYVSEFLQNVRLDHLETDVHSIISNAAIICIVVGVFVFLLSIVGCAGACCQQRCLLIVYAVIVMIILGAQIAAVVFTVQFKDEWQGPVKDEMKKVIKNDYHGDNGTDVITLGINAAFMEFDCCGVDDYNDVKAATGWIRTYTFNNQQVTFEAPYFCCKGLDIETPKIYTGLIKSVNDTECASMPTEDNSNYKTGCFKVLEDKVLRYSAIYLGVGISLLVIELFCIIFACYICCQKGREASGKLV